MSGYLASMTMAVANHLWQSTMVVGAAWLLTLMLRKNTARTRQWIWMAASLKFLLPFSLLVGVGSHLVSPKRMDMNLPTFYAAMDQLGQPVTQHTAPAIAAAVQSRPMDLSAGEKMRSTMWVAMPMVLATIWLCGFAVVVGVWCVRWRRLNGVKHAAVPMPAGREMAALRRVQRRSGARGAISLLRVDGPMEPGVMGVRRPVLLWPEGISERLSDAQLEAILAHELQHVKHRDNLMAMLHMAVEAMFWFHPLVWWMGARLVEEREHACDEDVLRMGNEPAVYAESILKTCEYCIEAPMACVAGVTGAELKKRIVQIMSRRLGGNLSVAKKILLASVAALVVAGPLVFGLVYSPQVRAQTAAAAVKNDPKELTGTWQGTLNNGNNLRIVFKMTKADGGWQTGMFSIDEGPNARSTGLTILHDTTVKYAIPGSTAVYEGKMAGDGSAITGTWTMNGKTLPLNLLRVADAAAWEVPAAPAPIKPMAADAKPGFEAVTIKPSVPNRPGKGVGFRGSHFMTVNLNLNDLIAYAYGLHAKQLVGAPDWAGKDLFDVDGVPDVEGRPDQKQMELMVQKLLRDRFKLSFHDERRELPVFIITVANGGPKIAKTTRDVRDPQGFGFRKLGDLNVVNMGMKDFATWMQSGVMDRPVVDQTGLTDRYDFQLKWTPDETQFEQFRGTGALVPPPEDDPNAPPNLSSAMQEQLGLKITAGKAQDDVMVIDHVERPSAN